MTAIFQVEESDWNHKNDCGKYVRQEQDMNKFLQMKKSGETILFSELLAEIPPNDVLLELMPDPDKPMECQTIRRGLEILKLRLKGLKQPEIAERLGLNPGQVAYAFIKIKNRLRRGVPSYINIDIAALREILGLPVKPRIGYTLLSELLRDMPSDEELTQLFLERENIIGRGKRPLTNSDLQLLQMKLQKRSEESIGAEVNMEAKEVHRKIRLTLAWIQRGLKIDLDIPELYKQKETLYQTKQSSCH